MPKCKSCDYNPHEHDMLNGYCRMCASNLTEKAEQLQSDLSAVKDERDKLKYTIGAAIEHLSDSQCCMINNQAKMILESDGEKWKH